MSREREFFTVRGYALQNQDDNTLTPSMEDYMEMAYRLGKDKNFIRMGDLAEALNVQPPSASKMVQKLSDMGYLNYKRYGVIEFTEDGRKVGKFLLERHETIEHFLKILGVTQNTLSDTEKIEHNISEETYKQIKLFVYFMEQYPQWLERYRAFLNHKNIYQKDIKESK